MDIAVPSGLFVTVGLVFLIGLATDLIGRRTRLPRVTLLLMFGFVIGPSGLALLSDMQAVWIDVVSKIALVMVGFLLGEHLTLRAIREQGSLVLSVSLLVTFTVIVIVTLGLMAVGVEFELALLLAAMSTATDPAATMDVAHESNASGPFTSAILRIVAIDDVWGLLAFSLVLTVVDSLSGGAGGLSALIHGLKDISGALLLGLGLGIPMALLTGRLREGEPMQAEALGFVFLCVGLSLWFNISYILASIVLGMTVANLAHHHKYAFHEIRGIEWPFLILFFVFAGASLDLSAVRAGGMVLFVYIVCRVLGRFIGGWLGGSLVRAPILQKRWFGMALLPQAGVAIGMALLGAQRFPQYAEALLSIAIAGTIFFEVLGPIITRHAFIRQGEITTAVQEKPVE